jgi:hypothetical protein
MLVARSNEGAQENERAENLSINPSHVNSSPRHELP